MSKVLGLILISGLFACDSGTTGPGFDFDMSVQKPLRTLSVTALPAEGGTVTSAKGGLSCGEGNTVCSVMIQEGTVVKLTATPALTYTFGGWSGRGCIGNDAAIDVTIAEDTACIVSFSK